VLTEPTAIADIGGRSVNSWMPYPANTAFAAKALAKIIATGLFNSMPAMWWLQPKPQGD
jgi:hypothetical protein